jgi:hypothetical protein
MFSRFPLIPGERGSLFNRNERSAEAGPSLDAAPVIRKLEEYRQLFNRLTAIEAPIAAARASTRDLPWM